MVKKPRGFRIDAKCAYCGKDFRPRFAEVQRGWGRFCSKSCKASDQNKRLNKKSLNHGETLSMHGGDDVHYTGQGWG